MIDNVNRSLKVFLCHASNDKPQVQRLYLRLINDGIDAWLDKEKLLPGQNWQIEIPKAVTDSDVVIVCLSTQSINKEGFVQKEIKIALDVADQKPEGTIFVIPARLENCDVPERLSQLHWVDLFSDDGYERLIKALEVRASSVGAALTHAQKDVDISKINEQEKNISTPKQPSVAYNSQQKSEKPKKKETKGKIPPLKEAALRSNKNAIELIKNQIKELEASKDNFRKPIPTSSIIVVVFFGYTMICITLFAIANPSHFDSGEVLLFYFIGLVLTYLGVRALLKTQNTKSLEGIEKEIQELKSRLHSLQQ